jgi:hypothetical protein
MLYFLDLETTPNDKCARQDLNLRPNVFKLKSI